jgi:hypothetical protein
MFVGFLRLGCGWIVDGRLTTGRQVPAGYDGKK